MQKLPRVDILRNKLRLHKITFFLILSIVALDQLSKFWIREDLFLGQSRPEEGFLRLTHVANEGGVFGLPVNPTVSLVLATLVVIIALFIYFQCNLSRSSLTKTAFALIAGGSIGNLTDRFRLGHVTDFIDVRLWGDYHWPVFNLADIAIVTGVVLTMLFLLKLARDPGRV